MIVLSKSHRWSLFLPALAVFLSALGVAAEEPSGPPAPHAVPARAEPLRQELLARMAEDQRARQEFIKYLQQHKGMLPEGGKDTMPPAVTTMCEIDRRNTARMKEIVERYGWPGFALVGKDGEEAAWLLVQHADHDHAFQKRCLTLLTEAVHSGQAAAKHMAYLTDRVRVAEKQKQLYGTQFHYVGNRQEADPIEDEAHLDARRQAVGLPSMAQYRVMTEKTYGTPAAGSH